MYKFLIVGCGGSGGAALSYMMDQLKSDLAAHGVTSIPSGWQFVHIDVPLAVEAPIAGLGNVVDQGGSYISTGPQSGSYSILDNGLSQTLGNEGLLEQIATWAPRVPQEINQPISNGAAQMRAVGRAIILSRTKAVYDGLERAFQSLNTVETNTSMDELSAKMPSAGTFNAASKPVVLVVSSMAGGAGASMALDVCRLLSTISGVSPGLTGVFMVTPDVFDTLAESARGGVRANALAMLGEIVATQTDAAEDHDVALLGTLGHKMSRTGEAPFARVFPVGRFAGAEHTLFGDGTPGAVYRGLGRGLAALITSHSATTNFVDYDLTNRSDPSPGNVDFLGWGTQPNKTPWGAFGFATLSMGRDRYRQYAAQRLARTAADHLREGHLQTGNSASGVVQITSLLDSQWSRITAALGLPATTGPLPLSSEQVLAWFTSTALSRTDAERAARGIADEHLVPFIPRASSTAAQWLPGLRQFVFERKAPVLNASAETAYEWSFGWSTILHARILAQVQEAICLFGLPYARAMIERVESLVRDQLAARLADLAGYPSVDLAQVPASFDAEVSVMRGVIANGANLVKRLADILTQQVTETVYSQSANLARGVLLALLTDVLAPLREALNESLTLLEKAAESGPSVVGLANVATNQYSAWPSDEDSGVPDRFDVADNEVLLTPSDGFGLQYEGDIIRAAGSQNNLLTFADARDAAARLVLSGLWPVSAGFEAPGGLVDQLAQWRPTQFNRNPRTGVALTPSRGRYEFHLTPTDLVGRSLAYVSRKEEAFEDFCALSLQDFATGTDIPKSALPARHQDLLAKFNETLSRALPLASVNSDAVMAIHGTATAYRFKFSSIPFGESPDIVDALTRIITGRKNIADETASMFSDAIVKNDSLTRINIFGSYRNYSPLVFDSLLVPVSQQWAATPDLGRGEFWANRRARPLPASLPMASVERRAMIAGWYIGQITSQVQIPEAPYSTPVQIWDDQSARWLAFPHPLLTPPSEFYGKSVDWLPAVMESYLLAIADAHEVPVLHSLRPYQLLRRLFDKTTAKPAGGMYERSAELTLATWLATGATASSVPSKIDAATLDERFDKAVEWLGMIHEFTGINYLPANRSGAVGGGPTSIIKTRQAASATPIFRDLAEDIYVVTGELIALMPVVRARAIQLLLDQPELPKNRGSIPEPTFGPF